MAWTDIDNALVSVGALPFATTIQALRDNPVAIANGDAGAPKIQTAGIADGAVQFTKLATGAGETDWVANRNIDMGVGGKGSYGFFRIEVIGTFGPGTLIGGGDLRYASSSPGADSAGAPAGTWRVHGVLATSTTGGGDPQTIYRATLCLRIV
jgi:hypothetical protein